MQSYPAFTRFRKSAFSRGDPAGATLIRRRSAHRTRHDREPSERRPHSYRGSSSAPGDQQPHSAYGRGVAKAFGAGRFTSGLWRHRYRPAGRPARHRCGDPAGPEARTAARLVDSDFRQGARTHLRVAHWMALSTRRSASGKFPARRYRRRPRRRSPVGDALSTVSISTGG